MSTYKDEGEDARGGTSKDEQVKRNEQRAKSKWAFGPTIPNLISSRDNSGTHRNPPNMALNVLVIGDLVQQQISDALKCM